MNKMKKKKKNMKKIQMKKNLHMDSVNTPTVAGTKAKSCMAKRNMCLWMGSLQ
jgi:hypothetical protein